MNKETHRADLGIALSLLLVLGAGQAHALNVLTFDTGNPERNEVVGALGFSITQVGSSGVSALDFSMFDVIYVAQSYEEFLGSSLLWSLSARAGDLQTFVSNGGSLVFGSPAAGINKNLNLSGGILPAFPSHPVTQGVDLSGLNLNGLPGIPFQDGNSIEWAADGIPAVPEPGTFALFGLGAAGLIFLRRRMNNKA